MSSWTIWEQLFVPNQVLKYISCLQWLISPNSGLSCPVVFSYCLLRPVNSLIADTTHMRSPAIWQNRRATLLAVSWKKVHSVWRIAPKWEQLSPFRRDGSFFRACVTPLPVRSSWEFLHIFNFIFILFILFTPTYAPGKVGRALASTENCTDASR